MALLSNLIKQRLQFPEQYEARSLESLDWLRKQLSPIRFQQDDLAYDDDLEREDRAYPVLGEMYVYFYGAKWDKKLPYWDRFPVVIPFRYTNNGWYGLNLHYIAPRYRILLLDAMYEFLMENEDKPEDTRFRVIYQMVKSMSKLRWARPCLKQYQYNYIDSRICQVMPEHFDLVAMLPTQRFQKANANYVYSRSREKF